MQIRTGDAGDLHAIARILQASPEAAQWSPEAYPFLVAETHGGLRGVLVWRETGPGEREVLNLAVDPGFRRQGIARALLAAVQAEVVFLEVRAGNQPALALYRGIGFVEAGRRPGYYSSPPEAAVVMRLQS